jgi:hypothetical protein
MHVVTTHHAFENMKVFGITNLHEQVTAALFDVALQDREPIFGASHKMHRQARDRVSVMPIFAHRPVLHCRQMSSNYSLAPKA